MLEVLKADHPQSVRHVFYRMTDPHLMWTAEAEAMPAHLLRQLLRDELDALIPERELRAIKVAEESEREFITSMAGAF